MTNRAKISCASCRQLKRELASLSAAFQDCRTQMQELQATVQSLQEQRACQLWPAASDEGAGECRARPLDAGAGRPTIPGWTRPGRRDTLLTGIRCRGRRRPDESLPLFGEHT